MSSISTQAEQAGREVHQSEWLDHAARIGLVAYGLVHLVIAWLAVQLALGDKEGSADSQGAVQQLNEQAYGEAIVWAVAIGMFLLAVWQGLEALFGYRDEEGFTQVRKRVTAAGKAVDLRRDRHHRRARRHRPVVVAEERHRLHHRQGHGLAGRPGDRLQRSGWPSSASAPTWCTARGRRSFAKHINAEGKSGSTGTAYLWFGKAGYTAKGVAFGIVGAMFLYAGLTHDPKESGGLDQALHKVLQQPFGPFLLVLIALGLGCYGLFCFARARHFND